MKYQYASKLFCLLIFTMSIFSLSLSASAAIMQIDMVSYDLATASQRSYTLHMLPTVDGAKVTLEGKDTGYSLSTLVVSCFNSQQLANSQGYLSLKGQEIHHADPALLPIINFTQDNRLRVSMAPLANAQSVLLDRDSLTVLVVDPTMMTLGSAGCQR